MINNLKLTFRRFRKQKLNTSLHIVGLTLGITTCLLIGLFLRHETSYDTYHENANRIYRINSIWEEPNRKDYHYSTPLPLSKAVRAEIPSIEKATLAHPMGARTIVELSQNRRFTQDHMLVVEPEYLDIFQIEMISGGTGHQAMQSPYQAIISNSVAKKYFGKENPLGKSFKIKNKYSITVAGVMKDIPVNSHLPASILLSYVPDEDFLGSGLDGWTYVSGTSTFLLLPENANQQTLKNQLNLIAENKINKKIAEHGSKSFFDLQPLTGIHTDAKYGGGGGWVQAVNPKWLWFFGIIGILVLSLACINFINLSTAQSITRAREIGVRKANGARKWQLVGQFLVEAFTLTMLSGILSYFLTYFSLPSLNTLLGKNIPFDLLNAPIVFVSFFVGIIITSLLAGIYPAWIISKFNPVVTLKGGQSVAGDHKSAWMRKSLVVCQFTISVGLLIAVAVIAQQVQFLRSKDLGFDKENIVNVEIDDALKTTVLSSVLRQIPEIREISYATAPPGSNDHWGTVMSVTNRENTDRKEVTLIFCDDNYAKLYNLKLLAGRMNSMVDTIYSSSAIPEEKQINKVVVNEKLLEVMSFGSPEQAIGKKFWAGFNSGNMEIVGVVSDFNTGSLHQALKPMLFATTASELYQASIKIDAGSDVSKVLSRIEQAWKKTYPDGIFSFQFLDEQIDAYYNAEIKLYSLFRIFACLAMLISCLGLWALASFAAQQRIKEIGIRKVLGASVTGITKLLTKDFLKLVIVSIVIASPITWYLMNNWLQDFAYRISIGWWIFAGVGFISVIIAILTVSFQAIKAAIANPVKSLRTE